MNRVQLTIALLLLAFAAKGQESAPRHARALKIYNLTDWERYSHSDDGGDTSFLRTTESGLRIFHPTIAYRWEQRKGRFHEVELIDFRFSSREKSVRPLTPHTGVTASATAGEQIMQAALSVRYEYQTYIRHKEDRPWQISLGLGINPYYFLHLLQPLVTTHFPERVHTAGMRLHAVPRFTWHLSERLFLDVNLPFCIAELRFQHRYDETPTIPIDERGSLLSEFNTFPALFSGRIGVGFKLY